MRKVLIASALVMSLAGGSAAMAGVKAAAQKTPAAAPADKAKTAGCEKQWKAEKKHSQTRKAFMAACTKA